MYQNSSLHLFHYRFVNKLFGQSGVTEDRMNSLEVTVFCRQMKASHSLVTAQAHVGADQQEVLDDVRLALGARYH